MTTVRKLLKKISNSSEHEAIVSDQTRREVYAVLTGRRFRDHVPLGTARSLVQSMEPYVAATPTDLLERAWRVEDQTNFHWWDCMMLAAAEFCRAQIFLSEDLNDRQKVGTVTIRNPFLEPLQES